ncbi:TVP38/TMEM64 family protein [Candidatus Gracilibacteria bacterium]|nr:TVP38/TMEM64 family protein [Candidatus Gracilibacteria bacterium]
MKSLKTYQKPLIFVTIIILIIIAYNSGLLKLLTLENLQNNQDWLIQKRDDNYTLFALLYTIIYIVSVAFSLPGATILTLTAGLVFGLYGAIFVIIGASIGAVLTALLTRYLFRDSLEKKFENQLKTFNQKINKNAVSYLLTLRLIPAFPFFLINILGGLSRVKIFTFAWTTIIGIIPGTLAFVNAGTEISKIESVSDILSPNLVGSFLILAIIALAPSFFNKKKSS